MDFTNTSSPTIPLLSHANIALTLPSPDDAVPFIAAFNSPAVYKNLIGPPFPYTQAHFDASWERKSKATEEALAELHDAVEAALTRDGEHGAGGKKSEKWCNGFPFTAIRETDPLTGKVRFLGDITVRRKGFLTAKEDERARLIEENSTYEAGDARIEWEIGCFLVPEVQGKGIMPAALKALIYGFMVPYMNAHRISAGYLEHNTASRKVFEKNDFVFEGIYPEVVELAESKFGVKGRKSGVGMMSWEKLGNSGQ